MAVSSFFLPQNHTTFDKVKVGNYMCSYACAKFFKKSNFGFEYPYQALQYLDKKNLLIKESELISVKVGGFIMIYCKMASETGHSAIYNLSSGRVHSWEIDHWVLYGKLSEFKKKCSAGKYFKDKIYFSYYCGNNKILSLR